MVKCLVLGADGFLGSHLVDALREHGYRVRAFDRFPDGKAKNLQNFSNVEMMQGDFLNRGDLEKAVKGMDYVFHFISTTTPATSGKDPLIDVDTNIRMSVELFQVCSAQKVKKVIFPSTGGAIYGRHSENAFKETDSAEPISPYAIGKLTIEGYLRYFKNAHNLDYVVYRVSNPYGERQNIIGTQGVIPIYLNLIKQGQPVVVFGDGTMVRDYIYVKDAIKMIVNTFSLRQKKPTYNLGSGKSATVNELIDAIKKVTKMPAETEFQPMRATDVQKVVLNVKRFEKEFKLKAQTSLEEGITYTWNYVKGRH